MRSGLRRRSTRLVAAAAVSFVAASTAAVALPVVKPQGKPARLDRRDIRLSGKGAEARQAAGSDSARRAKKAPPRTVRDGWSAEVDVPDDTQLVDFTWNGSAVAELQIRYRTDDGGWSEWTHLHSEPDEGPDSGGNGRQGIAPVWLGGNGTEDIQVKVVEGELTDLQVSSSHWSPPTGGATAGAEPRGPGIHSRSEWAPGGWRSDIPGCGRAPTVMNQLRHAVIHHTVNANTYSSGNVPGMLAAIYRYHTDGHGWCDIAYNFVIDRFGRVWQGRSGDINSPIMGGHAKGFNTDSVGVALLGQYQPGASPAAARPTTAEINATKSLLAWKLSIHGLAPYASVTVTTSGSTKYPAGSRVTIPVVNAHRDTSLTGCPGDYVLALMSSIRNDTTSLIRAAATPSTWIPFSNGQSFFRQLQVDAVGRSTNARGARMTSAVVRSGQSRAGTARSLVVSTETYNRIGFIVALYQATLTRLPTDTATFRLWVSRRDSGWFHEQLANAFVSSSGFRAKYGQSISNEQYVRILYQNVLAIPNPSNERVSHWTGQLASGRSRGYVLQKFIPNNGFQFKMHYEIMLTEIYFSLLRRLPDSAARSHWFPRWQSGSASTVTTVGVALGSAEYLNRF